MTVSATITDKYLASMCNTMTNTVADLMKDTNVVNFIAYELHKVNKELFDVAKDIEKETAGDDHVVDSRMFMLIATAIAMVEAMVNINMHKQPIPDGDLIEPSDNVVKRTVDVPDDAIPVTQREMLIVLVALAQFMVEAADAYDGSFKGAPALAMLEGFGPPPAAAMKN